MEMVSCQKLLLVFLGSFLRGGASTQLNFVNNGSRLIVNTTKRNRQNQDISSIKADMLILSSSNLV